MSGETTTPPEPPEGFEVMTSRGEFSTRNGPYYVREAAEEGVQQAFYASPHHCNGFGIVHGGMLAAFLDGLLDTLLFGLTTGEARNRPLPPQTGPYIWERIRDDMLAQRAAAMEVDTESDPPAPQPGP